MSKEKSEGLRVGIVFDSGKVSCKDRYDSISDLGVMDEVKAVRKALLRLGHRAILIPVGRRFRKFDRRRITQSLVSDLKKARPDAVFNLCETFCGDARLQTVVTQVLEELQIPYTGSPGHCIELTTDKTRTKQVLESSGIPTPRFRVFRSPEEASTEGLRLPLIVKPNFEDGSVGIEADSVVWNDEQLRKKVSDIQDKYRQPALAEEYIEGRELNVAVFINNGSTQVLPISEIVFQFPPGLPKITSYRAKWVEDSEEYRKSVGVCPTELPESVNDRIRAIAHSCITAAGCRDYARVDMRLDPQNQPYVIEVNANPDISPKAGFMRSFSASGRTYEDFVGSVLSWTMQRKGLASP